MHKFSDIPLTRKLGHVLYLQANNALRIEMDLKSVVTFSFIQYGENLGIRPLGQRVRESLLPMIEQNDLVVLDFTGVNVVSNSFADECIAKLFLYMTTFAFGYHNRSGKKA